MRYGVPYNGSKNAVAEWVVSKLPEGRVFIDLFAGGCAVTQAALISRKWERYIANDVNDTPKLFLDAINGKYTELNQTEFVTREMFFERKANDPYIRQCWSFGNNGNDYLYGKDLEEYKKAYHMAVFFGDLKPLAEFGVVLQPSDKTTPTGRYSDFRSQIRLMGKSKGEYFTERLESLERLERLQSLQSLESLLVLQGDYQAVPIAEGAVIYCDIPYVGTDCGQYSDFDHERFYKWAREQDSIFISEYTMPDDFIPVAEIEKTVLSSANGVERKATERIFTNERTYAHLDHEIYGIHEQMSIFDMLGGQSE